MSGAKLPPVALEICNEIPLGKGLGSSAAALTAGVVIGNQLLELNWSRHRILDEAAKIEGHPDNVAACVLGSVVASSIDSGGVTHAVRLELPANYEVAVVVPDFPLATSRARSVLPRIVQPGRRGVQRSALGAADCGAVHGQHGIVFRRSGGSHSPALSRAANPRICRDVEAARAWTVWVCLKRRRTFGAGFSERGREDVTRLFEDIFRKHGHQAKTYFTEIQRSGFQLAQL